MREADLRSQARHSLNYKIVQRLNENVEWSDLLWYIVEEGKHLLEADIVSLFLLSSDRETLTKFNVAKGSDPVMFSINVGIGGLCARTGDTINIPDCYQDSRFSSFMDRKTGYTTQSMLCVPIWGTNGQTLGVIQVCMRGDGERLQVGCVALLAIANM